MSETGTNDLIHKLFYWKVDGGYILAKTKVVTIFLYIGFVIDWFIDMGFPVLIDTVTAIAIFIIGFILHKLLKNDQPSENVVKNNDYGFVKDLTNLLFYWQDKETGEHILSKTKIITVIAFIVVALYFALTVQGFNVMNCFGAGIGVAIPLFVIGFIIHKLMNRD